MSSRLMIAFPCSRAEAIDPALAEIVAACGAERLDDALELHGIGPIGPFVRRNLIV